MKKDIESREDIKLLVDAFYQKVLADEVLAVFFARVVAENWEKHVNLMYDFWDNVIFFTGAYSGNPMYLHVHIDHIHSLKTIHFQKWVAIFTDTIRSMYSGNKTNLAIAKAENIASIMEANLLRRKQPVHFPQGEQGEK